MQVLPGSSPLHAINEDEALAHYPLFQNSQWHLPYYQLSTDKKNEAAPTGNLFMISIGQTGTVNRTAGNMVSSEYIFSKPFRLAEGDWLSIYTDRASKRSGVAVLALKNSGTAH